MAGRDFTASFSELIIIIPATIWRFFILFSGQYAYISGTVYG